MNAPEARKLIGKQVIRDRPNSAMFPHGQGIVEEVRAKNILINGNWEWLPDLVNLRLKSVDKVEEK